MTEKKLALLKNGLIVLGSVVLALLLTQTFLDKLTSLTLFAPMEKKVDFAMTDIYNAVEERRSAVPLSQDVIVVNVDSCDRKQTLDAIQRIAACSPKAIGVDLYFAVPQENNDYLVETILLTDNLVSSMWVNPVEGEAYERVPLSFFDEYFTPEHAGYVNLDAKYSWKVVRTFLPFVCTADGDTLPSMELELSRIAAPERTKQLLERGNKAETIDFTSCEIEVVDAGRLDTPAVAERIRDKVVLVGLMNDVKDCYLTPLHDPQSGVMIHAHALQTILGASYVRTSPKWLNWTIAIFVCLVFLILMQWAKAKKSWWGSLILRLGQFLIMYGLVGLGCAIYADWHAYVDFSPAILMMGLASFARDIISAIDGIVKNIVTQKQHKQ